MTKILHDVREAADQAGLVLHEDEPIIKREYTNRTLQRNAYGFLHETRETTVGIAFTVSADRKGAPRLRIAMVLPKAELEEIHLVDTLSSTMAEAVLTVDEIEDEAAEAFARPSDDQADAFGYAMRQLSR